MDDFRDFADQLQQEVVTDMAESYFGERKDLEDMITAFHEMVEELKFFVPKLNLAVSRLHKLLLDRETAKLFYISLDILPACIPAADTSLDPKLDNVSFALTKRGRYLKSLYRAYDLFQKVADEYLNGRYYSDPENQGRKRLTVHYIRLKALAEYINENVDKVNNQMSPSRALNYVKQMDTLQVEREDIMGDACALGECSLDRDLTFHHIDFSTLDLPVVQDLPRLDEVKSAISVFCNEIYPSRRHDIEQAMIDLRDG